MFSRNKFSRWFRSLQLLRQSSSRPSSPKSGCRLRIEQLEERSTPTANVTGLQPDAVNDTGLSQTDNITSNTTPILIGTADPDDTVEIFNGETSLGTTTSDESGNWTFAIPAEFALAEGLNEISATDSTGTGDALTVTIDTQEPDAPLNLTVNGGNAALINDSTPTISGTAEANSFIQLFNGETPFGVATADENGNWSFTPDLALTDDNYVLTAVATDVAGNVSVASDELAFTLDATAPDAPQGLTLHPDSDTGEQGDNRTEDTTPTITGTAEANSIVEVFDGENSLGTTPADGDGNWSFTPAAPLSLGTHVFTATATDAAGNTSVASAELEIVIEDVTAPAAPADLALHPDSDSGTPGDNLTNDSTPTITGTAEPGSIIEVFDGETSLGTTTADENGDWSFTPENPLSEGVHSFTATATDAENNTSGPSTVLQIEIDLTAPAAPQGLALHPDSDSGVSGDNLTNDTTPTITGTAEPGSTVEVFDGETSLGTTTTDANGNWSLTPTEPLGQGSHTLTATATDPADNTSSASTALVIVIDTTPPAAPQDLALHPDSDTGVPGDNETEDSTPTITGTAEPGSTIRVFDGETLLGTTTADENGDWSFTPVVPLGNGPHELTATATDAADNTSAASAPLTIVIDDQTPPDAPAALALHPDSDSGLAGDNLTNDTTPTITGTAEPGSTVEVFDGETSLGTITTDANGNWSFTPTEPLGQGSHTLTATATDPAGNTSAASDPLVIVIDSIAPAAPQDLTLHPDSDTGVPGDNETEDSTPTITGTAEPGSTIRVFDGETLLGTTTADENGDWSFTPVVPLGNGPHVITATATDAADNTSAASDPLTIVINDTTPPDAPANLTLDPTSDSGTPGDNLTNDTTPTITGTAEPGSTVEVFAGETSLGTTLTDVNGNWSFTPTTPLAPGVYTFTATATDPAGNTSEASAELVIEIDTTPPAAPAGLTLDPDSDSGTVGDNITNDTTPTITGTAAPGSIIRVFNGETSLGTTTADENGNWSFTATLGQGTHTLTATATNEVDNTSAPSAPLVLIIDSVAPAAPAGLTLDPLSDSGTVGDNLTNDTTPTITGTAEANSTVEIFNGEVLLGTTTANAAGDWSFTPTTALADGTYLLTAVAKDAAGNESVSSGVLILQIDATAPTTPTTPDMLATSDTGASNTDNITSDGSPVFTGIAEPFTLIQVFNGATLLGTVQAGANGVWVFQAQNLADGVHSIFVTSTDAAGNVSQSAALTFIIDRSGRLANPLRDVTGQFFIQRSRPRKVQRRVPRNRPGRLPRARLQVPRWVQTISFTNTSGRAIEGPLFLFLPGLPRNIRLDGASVSSRGGFIQVMPAGGSIAPGQTLSFTLSFNNPLDRAIRYTPMLMAGFGDL